MKLYILTLALDAMPFLPMQLAVFNRLRVPWSWRIVEGVADNVRDTSWCAKIQPRLSIDGTTEFLNSLRSHPRVRVYQQGLWDGKVSMCNRALRDITEPCVLMQIDADEIWTAFQLDCICEVFEESATFGCAQFRCRYFVGPNIITTTDGAYGNKEGEWVRAWRFKPGMMFKKHEPPLLPFQGNVFSRYSMEGMGLVFDHYAYAYDHQVQFKEQYYNYPNAVNQWRRLQKHQGPWPVRLKDFLPWVDGKATADLLHKP